MSWEDKGSRGLQGEEMHKALSETQSSLYDNNKTIKTTVTGAQLTFIEYSLGHSHFSERLTCINLFNSHNHSVKQVKLSTHFTVKEIKAQRR